MLLERRPRTSLFPVDARLVAAGAALIDVGALSPDTARAVTDAYARALHRRDPAMPPASDPAPTAAPHAAGAARELGRWRAVPSGHVIARPWGRLVIGHVLLTEEATALRVTVDPASPGAPSWPAAACSPGLPCLLEISDDRGTTSSADFEGGRRRGEQAWHGTFRARPPLAPDTAWISVLGERVDLTAEPPAIQAWTEQLEADDPARHHLWERVATRNDFHDPRAALEAAIAALAAVGALQADDPAADGARLAAELMHPGAAPARIPAAADALSMPGPWRSLLARWGRADGPDGSILVGKVSAPFDGVKVAVTAIDSRPECFSVDVEVAPGLPTGLPYRELDDLRHITWWAVDDQNNYSLAEQWSWSPGAPRAQGSLGFWPGLDPRATWVDLMPTATSARAVIRVPLPRATAHKPIEGPAPRSPLWTGRRAWVASHEGSEAFPVVSTGSRGDLRPERGSRLDHVAVLGFDHGPCPLECRPGEGRVQLAGLSGGPGQVPGVRGQLCQVHVDQCGSRVLLAPWHCAPQRQAGIVAPCLCRLFRGVA
jgi:hypothetical protein